MDQKVLKSAACAVISVCLLAGCSYFPAKMPDVFPTDAKTFSSSLQPSETSAQTAPSETTAVNPANAALKAFSDFIEGKKIVSTAGCFEKEGGRSYYDLTFGSYNIDELKKAVKFDASSGSTARYAVVDCGRDGISELAVCFDMLDHSTSSVMCIIGYEDGNLIMNSLLEESSPNEYRLYDTGYIESSTTPVRGVYKMVLIKVESGGKCSEVFTYNEYQGSYAANIIKHLKKTEEESGEGFENLPADFFVREFTSEGQVVISIEGLSGSEPDRSLEMRLIDKLKSLGAQEVSDEKMKELASTADYAVKEVVWTDCSKEKTPPSSVGIAKAAGNFTITVYLDPDSSEYLELGNVVQVLSSGTGTDMRFVCDSDDVTVILEKGAWDMNTDKFGVEKEIFNTKAKAGAVYQFNCVPGDVFPFYRIRAVKGSFESEWLILKVKDNKVMVIRSSLSGA